VEESAAERGLEAIQAARNRDCIVLPQEESYLEEWKTLYARKAWYAPSLFVESLPMLNSGVPTQPFLFEGTEVTVVAEENDMSCILYRGADNRLFAGWIQSIRLLDEFPGETLTIGEPGEGDFTVVHEAEQRRSDGWLPQTQQPYTVLPEPVKSCVGFTLEYQLIAENTARKELVFGPRTLWISDGESWTALGCFPYPENGTVHVQVRMDEPMDIAAIATVAHCPAPNMFDFRQRGIDFLIAGKSQNIE
jgi:hypothetical protein